MFVIVYAEGHYAGQHEANGKEDGCEKNTATSSTALIHKSSCHQRILGDTRVGCGGLKPFASLLQFRPVVVKIWLRLISLDGPSRG
jgi:hypothetical protein